jgi:hypothetical protein
MKHIPYPCLLSSITSGPHIGHQVRIGNDLVGTYPTYRKAKAAERKAVAAALKTIEGSHLL